MYYNIIEGKGKGKMDQIIKFKHFSFLIHLTKMLLLFEQETTVI